MLLNDIARLCGEIKTLESYRDLFHSRDAEVGTLKAQARKSVAGEIVSG